MGVPSLNDLAVDGTLNTTNQPTNSVGKEFLNFILNHFKYFKSKRIAMKQVNEMKRMCVDFYKQISFI